MTHATKAVFGISCTLLVMAALLFGPQGRLDTYWQAWVLLAVWLATSLGLTLYAARHDPKLLERRMRGGPFAEKEPAQKIAMSITSAGFVALFLVAALDHRWGWSHVPPLAALFGDLMVLVGWRMVHQVFRVNSFAAATVKIMPDQTLISTGPYALVRHPMYAGGLIMLFGIPIALASWWAVLVMLTLTPALIWRLLDEERLLTAELPGYAAYRQKVRFRLIPHVW